MEVASFLPSLSREGIKAWVASAESVRRLTPATTGASSPRRRSPTPNPSLEREGL